MPYPAPSAGGGAPVGRILAVVGLVVAVIAAGFVAWHFFWPRGGAGSPEAAAENLVLAAAEQDPVGMLDMVSPAEVEGFDDVYDAALERAEDEDLVEGDEEGITDAIEVELTDLEFEVDELGDDLARVTLTGGRYDVSWDPDELPERLSFLAEESEAESESGDLEDAFDGEEPSVVVVREGGRWYVTLVGTIADHAYQEGEQDADEDGFELEEPDYDLASEELDPIVGDDPEEVVENLVEAVNAGDAEELLANLPADLARPLRPYVPVVEGLQDEADWGDEIGLSVTVEDLELSTEELDDGKVKVAVEEGTFTASTWEDYDDFDYGSAEVDGDCITTDEGFGPETACLSEEETAADLGLDEIFFVVSEVDHGYQLDPTATWVEYASLVVENLDDDVVDEILDNIESEVNGEFDY
ncbi:hypothetical protein [Nocardioides antri]|uniref:hypothetical protein n=1 Tax=Nocardioides antri TaxID=2607659 RepID=UPI00165F6D77|nr:hypothetical protein [Nocardioides antri]